MFTKSDLALMFQIMLEQPESQVNLDSYIAAEGPPSGAPIEFKPGEASLPEGFCKTHCCLAGALALDPRFESIYMTSLADSVLHRGEWYASVSTPADRMTRCGRSDAEIQEIINQDHRLFATRGVSKHDEELCELVDDDAYALLSDRFVALYRISREYGNDADTAHDDASNESLTL